MKSVWHVPDHQALQTRAARLTPQHVAKWGRLTAPQMVVHLCDALRMASGEMPVASKNLPIRYPPFKQLIVYWMPIPKGMPTAPELIARQPGDWASDTTELRNRLRALVDNGPAACAAAHPAFGTLTGAAWGVLVYRHMDRHLRQFGV